tara:strand:- start:61 stop:318 length:258 start_codon:yes stop_codon:yes gene_type:complete
MGASIKSLKAGPTVYKFTWDDCVGYINQELSAAKPAECVTIGIIQKVAPTYIVVSTSVYSGGEGENITGDFTVLPTGMVRKVVKL